MSDGSLGSVRSSVTDGTRAIRSWTEKGDARLLLATMVGLYVLFTAVSIFLGLDLNGTVNTLRRITFLSAIYAMLTLGLNVQWGYAGLFNIGVAGFMAVGVYTMGILSTSPDATFPGLGLPLPVGILGGVLAAALVGVLASLPALRLRGDYLAIVTLALSEIIRLGIRSPITQEFSIGGVALGTGGSRGMSLPENPVRAIFYENPGSAGSDPSAVGEVLFGTFGAVGIESSVVVGWTYVLVLVLVLGAIYWMMLRIGYSPFGRVLKAIREDELVASSLGKDTRWFKVKVFGLGCAIMGLAAIMWRLSGGFVSTDSFQPIQTFYIFVALIIGGAGSNTGSVVGGAVFASLLFEGPGFVRRVVVQVFDPGSAPNTVSQAFGSLASGIWNSVAAIVDPSHVVHSLEQLAWALFDLVTLDPDSLAAFIDGMWTMLNAEPLIAYTFSDVNVSALRHVLLGVVLIVLIQRRPQGLLGHRQEVAASVDLSERSTEGDR